MFIVAAIDPFSDVVSIYPVPFLTDVPRALASVDYDSGNPPLILPFEIDFFEDGSRLTSDAISLITSLGHRLHLSTPVFVIHAML